MNITRHAQVIESGQSLSDLLILAENELIIAIEIPAAWTAAGLSFVAVGGDGLDKTVKKDGSEVTLTVSTNEYHSLELPLLMGIKNIKLRSGTSASPVSQGATRSVVVVTTAVG